MSGLPGRATLALERTALAWRRTALGAAVCALLLLHLAVETGDTAAVVAAAAGSVVCFLLAGLSYLRGLALHRGHIGHGRAVVGSAAAVTVLAAVLAVLAL